MLLFEMGTGVRSVPAKSCSAWATIRSRGRLASITGTGSWRVPIGVCVSLNAPFRDGHRRSVSAREVLQCLGDDPVARAIGVDHWDRLLACSSPKLGLLLVSKNRQSGQASY